MPLKLKSTKKPILIFAPYNFLIFLDAEMCEICAIVFLEQLFIKIKLSTTST